MNQLSTPVYYKIGAVSELTGIPVTTIRDWENRYKAFIPTKTSGNHRMYQQGDVDRAHLLKRLSEKGQSISTMAHLSNTELQALLRNYQLAHNEINNSKDPAQITQSGDFNPLHALNAFAHPGQTQPRVVKATVIGLALARRLEGAKFTSAFTRAKLHLSKVFMDLQRAREEFGRYPQSSTEQSLESFSQLVIVSQNTLHHDAADEICTLIQGQPARQVIVLYQFAPSTVTEKLRKSGIILKREPLTERELAELITSVLVIDAEQTIATTNDPKNLETINNLALIPPRKYSDELLLKVATISTDIFCECPKHVSEIITQLASFEKYSQDCMSQSHDDKELHGYLSSVSGTARALFELALEKIAAHEGIDLET